MVDGIVGLATDFRLSGDATVSLDKEDAYVMNMVSDGVLYGGEETFGNSPTNFDIDEWKGLRRLLFSPVTGGTTAANPQDVGIVIRSRLSKYLASTYRKWIDRVEVEVDTTVSDHQLKVIVSYVIKRSSLPVTRSFEEEI